MCAQMPSTAFFDLSKESKSIASVSFVVVFDGKVNIFGCCSVVRAL